MEQYLAYLEDWLATALKRRNATGFVIGISGGIDSAVLAYLLARQFKNNTLALILPCKSAPEDKKDAELVLENAGLEYRTIDLTPTHALLFSKIKTFTNRNTEADRRVIDGNMRARLRMSTMYAVAQSKNYLVVGSDNAVEWYTGYFTKYGDGGVDLAPLQHLLKSEVYEAAQLLGVPQAIIDKEPSAGLWEGQTDESEMGVTYAEIEAYLQGEPVSKAAEKRIAYWHNRSDHKRELPWVPERYNN